MANRPFPIFESFIGNGKAKGTPLWPAGHFSKWIKVTRDILLRDIRADKSKMSLMYLILFLHQPAVCQEKSRGWPTTLCAENALSLGGVVRAILGWHTK
jgi:hypothetical protein